MEKIEDTWKVAVDNAKCPYIYNLTRCGNRMHPQNYGLWDTINSNNFCAKDSCPIKQEEV